MSSVTEMPTQMAIGKFEESHLGIVGKMEDKTSGRRRVYAETGSGSILGLELVGADISRTCKRRLLPALDVPNYEISLRYWKAVLRGDLNDISLDSPLNLSRNFLHKSPSTPCFSPTERDLQLRDRSGPVEILGSSNISASLKQVVKDIVQAIHMGIEPLPVWNGLGGAYYFRNCMGKSIAIVKPIDEEPFAPNNPKGLVGKALGFPGLKWSVRVGETGFREVAAYLLDHGEFAQVPPTVLIKVRHSILNVNDGLDGNEKLKRGLTTKIASLQQFIPHDCDASDHGTSSFSIASVHRIGILDIRIMNTDRHAGNLLVRKLDGKSGQVELFPIDHGLCLPESLEDPYFEWIHWPQASIPFSEEELEYISDLDPVRDSDMLRKELPMIREACLRVLNLCTIFLKEAATFGLCLAEIGEMMSRQCHGQEPSELEVICAEARELSETRKMLHHEVKVGEREEFLFHSDSEEDTLISHLNMEERSTRKLTSNDGFRGGTGQNALSERKNSVERWTERDAEDARHFNVDESSVAYGQNSSVSNFPPSNSSASFDEKSCCNQNVTLDGSHLFSTSYVRSVNGQKLSAGSSFLKLDDLNEADWAQFLEKFQKLLHPAFGVRRSGIMAQKQRLGTSCRC